MLLFWILASILAVIQDVVGVALAKGLGVHPFLGLIAGSITMTGGHGTGAAFGKLMEDQYGFTGGVTLAMAAATFGLVSGGSDWRARRHRAHPPVSAEDRRAAAVGRPQATAAASAAGLDTRRSTTRSTPSPPARRRPPTLLLKVITIILVAMWAGSLLSRWLGQYVTLPAYIGAMIAAAVIRNGAEVDPATSSSSSGSWTTSGRSRLSLFLAMALMSLKLWELLDLALPMLVILCVQVTMMAAFAYFVTFRLMGRDYDAAVMAGGHCGFGLGATPNAVANMEALVERFGVAPRAFLVVPMVGAFFIDFTNALIITTFINFVK